MNTKKAVWISKPEKIKATLHTLSFRSEEAHSVFFVIGEEDEISLSYSSDTSTALILLHTPEEYIVFGKERIVLSFKGVRTEIPSEPITALKLTKKGALLIFSTGKKEVLRIEKEAFSSSASFGLAAKGKGEVTLEVF